MSRMPQGLLGVLLALALGLAGCRAAPGVSAPAASEEAAPAASEAAPTPQAAIDRLPEGALYAPELIPAPERITAWDAQGRERAFEPGSLGYVRLLQLCRQRLPSAEKVLRNADAAGELDTDALLEQGVPMVALDYDAPRRFAGDYIRFDESAQHQWRAFTADRILFPLADFAYEGHIFVHPSATCYFLMGKQRLYEPDPALLAGPERTLQYVGSLFP